VNAASKDGCTALDWAASAEADSVVRLLLESGAEPEAQTSPETDR
jgi:ankyrin repeat protein